jgi:hypothetical protein
MLTWNEVLAHVTTKFPQARTAARALELAVKTRRVRVEYDELPHPVLRVRGEGGVGRYLRLDRLSTEELEKNLVDVARQRPRDVSFCAAYAE